MSMNEVVKKLSQAIDKQADKAKTTAYDTPATVRRIEGDTAWVHIPGGVDETPVKLTISAKEGDQVQVRVSGGSAFMVGNGTNPPTDDTRANSAYSLADIAAGAAENALGNAARAREAADSAQASASAAESAAGDAVIAAGDAQTAAGNAQQSADSALVSLATAQDVVGVLNWITAHGTMTLTSDVTVNPAHVYFIVDAGGDYVVGGTHYSIVSEPKDAELSTYYELTVDESVQNYVATHIAVDSEGLWLIPEDNATIASSSKKILIAVGGAGHTYSTAGTYIIQKVNGTDTMIAKFTADGATMQAEGSTQIAHFGYGPGTGSGGGTNNAPYYTLGIRTGTVGNYSMAEGASNKASGYASHAEGYDTTASGALSHAEGLTTTASGRRSHAEGRFTTASGDQSHAEGYTTIASGSDSHAQNGYTIAQRRSQTAIGEYNVADTTGADGTVRGDYVFMIGNGTAENARSNALTVDWSGNVEAAGGADLAALTENSGTYSGGLNDEALLTTATITKWQNILS